MLCKEGYLLDHKEFTLAYEVYSEERKMKCPFCFEEHEPAIDDGWCEAYRKVMERLE